MGGESLSIRTIVPFGVDDLLLIVFTATTYGVEDDQRDKEEACRPFKS
jgi:hypothetical protein